MGYTGKQQYCDHYLGTTLAFTFAPLAARNGGTPCSHYYLAVRLFHRSLLGLISLRFLTIRRYHSG
jgi:hypothetical protein